MIKLLIIDVDGIMTTGMKYYNREGEVKLKTFCDKDWTSIKRFRAAGVHVVFLTGDGYNKKILENRNLHVIVNRGCGFHSDKANYLDEILEEYECTAEDTGFIGDDLFDIGIMRNIFIQKLVEKASKNKKIVLVVGDLGFGIVEPFKYFLFFDWLTK